MMAQNSTAVTPEDRYFETADGFKMHYRVCGTGEPLIILPGYSETEDSFDSNYEELQKHFTVYTVEYRAHGKSEAPSHGYHTERLAADFKEFLDHEDLNKVNVVAHSMGNSILWCYFEIFGQDRIGKYILEEEGPTFMSDPAWSEEEKQTYRGVMDWDMYLRSEMIEMMFQQKSGETADQLAERRRGLARLWKDHIANDWSDIIPTIKVDTMIMMGAKSHFAAEPLWNFMHKSIKNSKLEIVEDAGHNIHADTPDKFNQLIIDYLS